MYKYFIAMLIGISIYAVSFVVASLSGCVTLSCEYEKLTIARTASVMASAFDCDNPSELENYAKKIIRKLNICNSNINKVITGKTICTESISNVLDYGIDYLPKDAECSGGSVVDVDKQDAINWCEALFLGEEND